MTWAIEIDSLSKTYRERSKDAIQAVEDLNLCIPVGQVLGLLGANGAGKTTTIKMTCGLVTPTTGQVRVGGYDIRRQRGRALRQIGVVLEGTRNIYWRLSAWDNLLYFGRLKDYPEKLLKPRAEQLLRDLDLWERRHDATRNFSRGMQQKVAVACALIADPPIVLLDEPTIGLDVQAARTLKGWVTDLARNQGKTIVLTTHQLDVAEELCDQVAIMQKGRLIRHQPLTELLDLFRQEYYQIKVKGCLDTHQLVRFPGLNVTTENDDTILTGAITSQSKLHSILNTLDELGVPLVAVTPVEPNLEEIFINLNASVPPAQLPIAADLPEPAGSVA